MKNKMLIVLGLVLLTSALAIGQGEPRMMSAYLKWKADALKGNRQNDDHYCLVASPRRIDATTARIKFLAVGKMRGFVLEIQPLKIERASDGSFKQDQVGSGSSASLKAQGGLSDSRSTLETEVPVTSETNGLEIKWKIDNGSGGIANTLTVWLTNTHEESVIGVVSAKR
jgi:hypothetical protein